jgi:hypothetical protein
LYKSKQVTSSNCQIQEQDQWDDDSFINILVNVKIKNAGSEILLTNFAMGIPTSSDADKTNRKMPD